MTTILCTDAERDLILAGVRYLVVPGVERPVWEGDIPKRGHFFAPQRWVDATGPCPTCNRTRVAKNVERHWCGECDAWNVDECHRCDIVTHVLCPDCIDGRKRVALRMWGWPVFAHATVEVLPVYDLDGSRDALIREEAHAWMGDRLMVWRPGRTEAPLWDRLDPSLMAVTGRDWIVALDNVELT